ncbi:BCL-2-associated athanogene 5 [Striga asiatica]|uniref:BCL-2-associated athanogene 5 n=1 Tax=Striga asiatica TaxID=4170 RepID=A0A5A7R641_STRAF|nr:BCL-2-associated athanogene 5 [Striga asiatica]
MSADHRLSPGPRKNDLGPQLTGNTQAQYSPTSSLQMYTFSTVSLTPLLFSLPTYLFHSLLEMKSYRRPRFSPSTATTVVYTFHNETYPSNPGGEVTGIPIRSTPDELPAAAETIPITVHIPQPRESYAAVKIQSAYRSHVVRMLVRKISAVNSEANYWQRLIQRQARFYVLERERIKINEALMGLLFRLDSVPGLDPNVRELRRHVSRKIVGLQEILDAVSDTRVEHWDGFLRDWDDIVAGLEKEACKEKGGGKEIERFCAEHLGFQCLQRILQESFKLCAVLKSLME